jgi:argininosuccinate lyase
MSEQLANQATPPAANKALWGGRFEAGTDPEMQAFGASLPVDIHLWRQDIAGSRAHAHMLATTGVISEADNEALQNGLTEIARDIDSGELQFDLSAEDIHMAIESELTRRVGAPGARLHSGRSRNDQVATDFRLYCKQIAIALRDDTLALRRVIFVRAREHIDVIMPGYTHLQKAQPVLWAQHLLAWQAMLSRDQKRLADAARAADASPLGAAALAGTSYPIDRHQTAAELGFGSVIANSMDAVSDRDFACDLLYAVAMTMQHLSRIAEELILWSTAEFGFIRLSDAYSTGSSIMPQKQNPDFAELIRGRSGRAFGNLMALLTTLKALPLTYNKDLQEDKLLVLESTDVLRGCLKAASGMIATLRIDAERMLANAQDGFLAATDLADWLVGSGLPFRQAHEVVGRLVLVAQRAGLRLDQLSLDQLREQSPNFTPDALKVLDLAAVVDARDSLGGTAPASVRRQLDDLAAELG